MKKITIVLVVIGALMVVAGVLGFILSEWPEDRLHYDSRLDGIDRGQVFKPYGRPGGGHMMGGRRYRYGYDEYELIDMDELIEEVEEYIDGYDADLVIGDVFVFEDSEYYFSILEEDTGRGAMELLVNQYTGRIFPEFGPNMMWNLKYGMHREGGMMQGDYFDVDDFNVHDVDIYNEISPEMAYNEGIEYLNRKNQELDLGDVYHEFYGYYTFHVEMEGVIAGMLSVNGFTGEVWYHDWHGTLIDVIDMHDEDH